MIPCLITARLTSERMPKKHLLQLGPQTVIEHVVRRCEHFGFKPYVCVPMGEHTVFNEVTSCLDIFEGDPNNVEARVIDCALAYDLQVFHQLDGDDPWFDEYAVIDSWQSALTQNLSRVRPSYQSQSGSGRVGTSYNLGHNAKDERQLADRMENYPWPQRVTLDYPEDYHLMLAIERMVGGYMAPRRAVDELFVKNPDLYKVNWFRTAEWKDRQRHESRQRPGNRVRETLQ